jgi:hypothetical protein
LADDVFLSRKGYCNNQYDARAANHDAQHGQSRAHFVASQRVPRKSPGFGFEDFQTNFAPVPDYRKSAILC